MKLPKVIYARMEKDGNECYVVAHENLADCTEDGVVNVIGTYFLKETHKYEKVVSACD